VRKLWPLLAAGIAIAWIALCALAVAGIHSCYRRDAAFLSAKQDQLVFEFEALPPPVGATVESGNVSWKPGLTPTDGHVMVGASYIVKVPYEQIRSHYDALARLHGWQVLCEKPVRDWGRDFGGRFRDYRKGEFRASLQYAGTRADYGWTYAFDVTWGMPGDCRQ
jgi:hypothetical protein